MRNNLSLYKLGLLRDGQVILADHHTDWMRAYSVVSTDLKQFLKPFDIELHHIGSTAIANTRAKPILDIVGIVDNIKLLDEKQECFERYGLMWKGENDIAGRRYCVQYDETQERTYMHLHMFERGHPAILNHLLFRDYLRAFPAVAQKYDAEKMRLIKVHVNNRSLYVANKTSFIEGVLREAHQWRLL